MHELSMAPFVAAVSAAPAAGPRSAPRQPERVDAARMRDVTEGSARPTGRAADAWIVCYRDTLIWIAAPLACVVSAGLATRA